MLSLRNLLVKHCHLALALAALALCVKAIVPSGFMLDGAGKALTITICGQSQGLQAVTPILIPQTTKSPDAHHQADHPSEACPYAGLAMAALTAAPLALLALALAFILARGFVRKDSSAPAARAFLRPPLRGPPLLG